MRDIPDRLGILGDILTGATIAARGGTHQFALYIEEAARHAVDLGFGGKGDHFIFGQAEKTPDAVLEIANIFCRESIIERQHGNAMCDRRKLD